MTAQINDRVEVDYDDEAYALAGISGGSLFMPQDHGLTPVMLSTACWRGWYARYLVREQRLVLGKLWIGLADQQAEQAARGEGPVVDGRVPRQTEGPVRPWLYDLDLAVPFTGGLLLGRGFIRPLYAHMGFHPAWKYREVLELTVEDGRVTGRNDVSESMAALRETLQGNDRPGATASPDVVKAWIAQTFSRTYPGLAME